ncbi:hypothetical protein ACFQJ7_04395 [Halovenus rubra]|uniref:Uncharacterized protein n=2 Tax=Halovenus rubra TaxID=869890 RepID=A0ACC7DYB3_9EURY|nr:hypothetical protein [Halovenus rubra]
MSDAQTDDKTVDTEWVEFEYEPPSIATATIFGGSLVAIAALALSTLYMALGAGAGAAVVVAGVVKGRQKVVTLGSGVLFVALVGAGLSGSSPVAVVVTGAAMVVVFDAGRYAVQLGTQIGRSGTTTDAELRHIGLTVTVSALTAILGTVIFLVAPGQQPSGVVVLLLLAGVLFISALVLRDDVGDVV